MRPNDAGVPTANAAAVAATTRAAAIKTMAANTPTDPQTLLGIRGIAPTVTASSVYLRPGRSGEERGLSWDLAVGGGERLSWLEWARAFAIPRETWS